MDLTLNNIKMLICHKTQTNKHAKEKTWQEEVPDSSITDHVYDPVQKYRIMKTKMLVY